MTRGFSFLLVLLFSSASLAEIAPYVPHQAVLAVVLTSEPLIKAIRKDSNLSKCELVSASISHTGQFYDSKFKVILKYSGEIEGEVINCSLTADTALKVKTQPGKNGGPPRPVGIEGVMDPVLSEVNCDKEE